MMPGPPVRLFLRWEAWLLAGSLALALGITSIQRRAACAVVSSVTPSVSSQSIETTKAAPATDSLIEALVKAMASSSPSERQQSLSILMTRLAASEPDLALQFALSEPDPGLQRSLLSAALRGWAGVDPRTAGAWALRRPLAERVADVIAVIDGTGRVPALAVEVATRAIRDDPEFAHDYGTYLITALARTGDFMDALKFACDGPDEQRLPWALAALSQWANRHPREAADAALALTNRDLREGMVCEVMERWSQADPAAAVAYASTLERGADRRLVFTAALAKWARQDLVQAADWINRWPCEDEIDEGVAAVATSPALVIYRPTVALEWAASIHDPSTRTYALAAALQAWARTDPDAAAAYVARASFLSADDRKTLCSTIASIVRRTGAGG